MNKYKNKYRTLMFAVVCVVVLAFSYYQGITILKYISFVGILATTFISTKEDKFNLLLFFLPWAPVLKIKPGTTSLYTVVLLVLMIITMVQYKPKIIKKHCITVLLIALITIIGKLYFSNPIAIDYIFLMVMLFLFPYIFENNKEELNLRKNVIYFSIGIITAAIFANLLSNIPEMLEYIDVYEWEEVGLVRRSGFYGDANFYSAQILAAISALTVLLINMRKVTKEVIIYLTLIVALIYCGFLSVSKMFILLLILIIMLFILAVCFVIKNIKVKMGIMLTILLATVVIGLTGIFSKQIKMYTTRFNMVTDSSSLTTGRVDIYENYLKMFINRPDFLLIGQGFSNIIYEDVRGRASHNTIIQLVYQFGLIGSIILLVWIRERMRIIKEKELNYERSNILLVLISIIGCFAPWLALDILFFDDFFIILFFFISIQKYLISNSTIAKKYKDNNLLN